MFKPGLRLRWIGRDAENHGIVPSQLPACVAKLARLGCSAGRIGLGEEVEDNVLTLHVTEGKRLIRIRSQADSGGFGTFLEFCHSIQILAAAADTKIVEQVASQLITHYDQLRYLDIIRDTLLAAISDLGQQSDLRSVEEVAVTAMEHAAELTSVAAQVLLQLQTISPQRSA